jgi:zinc transport system substrate-binding protein
MPTRDSLLLLALWTLVSGCGEVGAPDAEAPIAQAAAPDSAVLSVYTTNYPLAYFGEAIGGPHVEVFFPAPAGVDPAYWSPQPEVIAEYQQADLILLNGAGYEKWLERASLPTGKQVSTSASFENRYIPLEEGIVHTHGLEGEHSHKGWAFTTWLDPTLAIEQAKAVRDAVSEARPEAAAEFAVAFERLEADLSVLDARLGEIAAEIGARPILFSHPVYQYLDQRLGSNGRSVHWEPGEMPQEAMWQELSTLVQSHPAALMLWEGQPLEEVRSRLAGMGIESVVYDPCGNRPEDGDFESVMQQNLENLQVAAREQGR